MNRLASAAVVLAAAGCITLGATHAPIAGTPRAAYGPCIYEDGSAPDQVFPCYWNGGANGIGRTYVLTLPMTPD